jgi:pilus assembly protein CpaC
MAAIPFIAGDLWARQGPNPSDSRTAPPASSSQPAAAPAQLPVNAIQTIHMLLGHSRLVNTSARITRVSIADPTILDVLIVGPHQVLVNGKTPGSVSLVLWDESGESQSYDMCVDLDTKALRDQLHAIYPNQPVRVDSQGDTFVLSGQASSQAIADKMLEMAKAVSPKAVSEIEISGTAAAEIMLQVKFAEVDRSAVQELGLNILSLPGASNIGTISTQQFGGPQLQAGQPLSSTTGGFSLSDLLNIFLYRPDINLAVTIKALEDKDLLQILAEPNVITQSGKDASFLSGGEFPFPVVQNSGTGIPSVTVEFKEYGIKLSFTPTLTSEGLIHLKVRPEVSSLDYTNSLTLQGFVIPSLSTRRVESEMDLRDGQSFAIAGLVNDQVVEQLSKIPGLGDIPLFGKLFNSRSRTKSKSELLILVTPHIIQPSPPRQLPPLPTFPQTFLKPDPPAKSGMDSKK